jgi:hypothetical protein
MPTVSNQVSSLGHVPVFLLRLISCMLPLFQLFTAHNTDQVLQNTPRLAHHLCGPRNAYHAISNAWDSAAAASETNCFPIVSTLRRSCKLGHHRMNHTDLP